MHRIDKWNQISKFKTAIIYDQVDKTFFDYWIQKYGSFFNKSEIRELYYLYSQKE